MTVDKDLKDSKQRTGYRAGRNIQVMHIGMLSAGPLLSYAENAKRVFQEMPTLCSVLNVERESTDNPNQSINGIITPGSCLEMRTL